MGRQRVGYYWESPITARCREICTEDIAGVNIPQNSFVLIRTARSEKEIYGTPAYFSDHPHLSPDLIEYLLDNKIRFIGIDYSGIRRGAEHKKADRLCESKGVYVIENLNNLDKVKNAINLKVYTLWFDDDIATGLPCRIIASTNDNSGAVFSFEENPYSKTKLACADNGNVIFSITLLPKE